MQSRNIVFVGKDEMKVIVEEVREPGPDEVILQAYCHFYNIALYLKHSGTQKDLSMEMNRWAI